MNCTLCKMSPAVDGHHRRSCTTLSGREFGFLDECVEVEMTEHGLPLETMQRLRFDLERGLGDYKFVDVEPTDLELPDDESGTYVKVPGAWKARHLHVPTGTVTSAIGMSRASAILFGLACIHKITLAGNWR